MAQARVELTDSVSHTSRFGRVLEKGKPTVITKPEEIAYYQGQAGFVVTILDEPQEAQAPKRRVPTPPPPPDEPEPSEEEEPAEEEHQDGDAPPEEEEEAPPAPRALGRAAPKPAPAKAPTRKK